MKYGLLINKMNQNIGDDIQSYAESLFLPRIDTVAHREDLDIFQYGDGSEPVAMIMGAWFMWRKFNWPPARQIIPLLVSYHTFNRKKEPLKADAYTLPIFNQYMDGIGGQWFRDYGPVGCRDLYTCEMMDRKEIPNYFSGCVTLTLPKQKETEDKGTYIVLVDIGEKTEKRIREIVGDRYEIRKTTHSTPQRPDDTWEEREALVKEYLGLYQNAKYVISSRLHATLPCLAMEVPVLMVLPKKMDDVNRFAPYAEWLHICKEKDFEEGAEIDFDFENGTPNKGLHMETRNALIGRIREFLQYCEENDDKPLEFFDKCSYTEQECLEWRVRFMRRSLRNALLETRDIIDVYRDLVEERKQQDKVIKRKDKEYQKLQDRYDELEEKYNYLLNEGAMKAFKGAFYRQHIKDTALDPRKGKKK